MLENSGFYFTPSFLKWLKRLKRPAYTNHYAWGFPLHTNLYKSAPRKKIIRKDIKFKENNKQLTFI